MRRIVLIALLPFVLAGCAPSETGRANVTILAVGDSNTAGHGVTPWPYRLVELLGAAHPSTSYVVDDRAVSGTHSGETAAAMPKYLASNPDIVCIMTGTNDVTGSDWPSGPRQTKVQTEANLRSILEQSLAASSGHTLSGHPLVVLIQPPVATSYACRTSYVSGRWRAYDDAEGENNLVFVKDLCVRLGREYGVPVVRTWDDLAALGYDGTRWGPVWCLQDGVHLTEGAQRDLAKWVRDAIAPALGVDGVVVSQASR
jgi:lysophospholipase L1-like esterase